jgi:hypothetical protein
MRQDGKAIFVRLQRNFIEPPDIHVQDRVTGRTIGYFPYKGWTKRELAKHALGGDASNKLSRIEKALPYARELALKNGFCIPFASGTKLYILTKNVNVVRNGADHATRIGNGFMRRAQKDHGWADAQEAASGSFLDEPAPVEGESDDSPESTAGQ